MAERIFRPTLDIEQERLDKLTSRRFVPPTPEPDHAANAAAFDAYLGNPPPPEPPAAPPEGTPGTPIGESGFRYPQPSLPRPVPPQDIGQALREGVQPVVDAARNVFAPPSTEEAITAAVPFLGPQFVAGQRLFNVVRAVSGIGSEPAGEVAKAGLERAGVTGKVNIPLLGETPVSAIGGRVVAEAGNPSNFIPLGEAGRVAAPAASEAARATGRTLAEMAANQRGMIGEGAASYTKRVGRPVGFDYSTMGSEDIRSVIEDTQNRLMDYSIKAGAFRDAMETDPHAPFVNLLAKSGSFKGEIPETLTVNQAKELLGKTHGLSPAVIKKGRVQSYVALDLAANRVGETTDEFAAGVRKYYNDLQDVRQMENDMGALQEELNRAENALKQHESFAPRPAVQSSMGVGEKPSQGELLPEFRASTAKVGKPSEAAAAKLTAQQERAATVASGQAELPKATVQPVRSDMGVPIYAETQNYRVYDARYVEPGADATKPFALSKLGSGVVQRFSTPEEAIAALRSRLMELPATTPRAPVQAAPVTRPAPAAGAREAGAVKAGDTVLHPNGTPLTVVDASDPALLTVRTESGATMRIGRSVVKPVGKITPEVTTPTRTVEAASANTPAEVRGQLAVARGRAMNLGIADAIETLSDMGLTPEEVAARIKRNFALTSVSDSDLNEMILATRSGMTPSGLPNAARVKSGLPKQATPEPLTPPERVPPSPAPATPTTPAAGQRAASHSAASPEVSPAGAAAHSSVTTGMTSEERAALHRAEAARLAQESRPPQPSEGRGPEVPPQGPPVPPSGAQPTGAVPPEPPSDPVKKLTDLIASAKPVRAETELLKTQALGQKAAIGQRARESGQGAAAFHEAKGTLKGELPRAQWTPPGDSLTQPEQTQLFDAVRTNNKFDFFDYVNTSGALEKVLAGVTPTNGEIKLLEKQFGPEMAQALLGQRPVWQKLLADANNAWNLSRGIKASVDLSFHMLQGGMMAFADTPTWIQTWKPALRGMWTDKNYKALEDEIMATPMFVRQKARAVEWVDPFSVTGQHAEGFSAATPGLIGPAIGKAAKAVVPAPIQQWLKALTYPLRASEREFSMTGNFMRYQHLAKRFSELDAIGAPSYSYDAAVKLANMMTGRGPLTKQASAVVNFASKIFWAPRLGISVVQTATAPIWLRGARLEATVNLGKFFGYTAGTILAGKAVGLWDTETDPRSTNFMRVKIGNTWYNPLGKYQQDVRLMGQFVTGQRKALQSGNIVEAKRLEGLARAAWSQLHPAASTLVNLEEKQNVIGEPRSLQSFDDALVLARDMFAPLSPDQIVQAYQTGGPVAALKQAPNVIGLNANDIPPTPLDKAAQALGKDRFNQLTLEQKAQIRVDPAIRAQQEKATANDPLGHTAWQAQEDQIARDGFLKTGISSTGRPFTPRMWLDALHSAQDEARARRDIQELMRPIIERGASDATIQATNDYFTLMKQFERPGNLFDMEGWQNAKEDFLLQLDKPLRESVLDATGSSTTPATVAYYRLLDKARPYFDVERNVIGPDPQTQAAYDAYRSANPGDQRAILAKNPRLAADVARIEAQRKQIRMTDADVDLYLHLFKGGTLTVPSNLRLAAQGKLEFAGVRVQAPSTSSSGGPVRPVVPPRPIFARP